jgi:hypothetical protein
MKKIFHNNRLIAVAFFTVFSMASAPAVFANGPGSPIPVELKYVGKVNNQSVFQLNFAGNAEENELTITILDIYGNCFYRENIKSENFSKKFLFNNDELGDDTLHFVVTSKKSNKSVVYEINRQVRYVEQLVVNLVKN